MKYILPLIESKIDVKKIKLLKFREKKKKKKDLTLLLVNLLRMKAYIVRVYG
jgi:hypothetical protein